MKAGAPPVPLTGDAEELPGVGGGLDGPGAGQLYPFHRHVLVAGEEQIEVQFPGNLAGQVLAAVREHPPGLQLLLEAAVVDTHADITLIPEGGAGRPGGLKGIGDPNPLQVLWLLPHVYEVGDHAGDPYPQAVGQGVHRPGADAQLSPQVLYICTQANSVHGIQIIPEGSIAKVEVVVAQGEVVQTHGVEGSSHRMGRPLVPVFQIVLGQGSPLQGVPPVQHQGVPAFFHLGGQIQQPGVLRAVRGIVHREDMAVGVRGVINLNRLFHDYPLASLTRILVEIHSTISTSTMRPARMAPASSQR